MLVIDGETNTKICDKMLSISGVGSGIPLLSKAKIYVGGDYLGNQNNFEGLIKDFKFFYNQNIGNYIGYRKCKKSKPHFYINNNKIFSCAFPCYNCLNYSSFACITCISPYYLEVKEEINGIFIGRCISKCQHFLMIFPFKIFGDLQSISLVSSETSMVNTTKLAFNNYDGKLSSSLFPINLKFILFYIKKIYINI